MQTAQMVGRLIRQCGRVVQFPTGSFLAYLNPMRERTGGLVSGESGRSEPERWLVLISADKQGHASRGMVFECGDTSYLLERLEPVFWGKDAAYLWGIASRVQEGGAANG